jgi:chromosome segregation ATPase
VFAGFVAADFFVQDVLALTTVTNSNAEKTAAIAAERTKLNAEKTTAVNAVTAKLNTMTKERDQIKANLEKNQKEVVDLNTKLKDAIQEKTKLSEEKVKAEKTSTAELNAYKKEIQKKLDELEKAKKDLNSRITQLNGEKTKLQEQLATKERERAALDTKLRETTKAAEDFKKAAAQKEAAANKKFEEEKKRLNATIKEKTQQLTKKTTELKNLTAAGEKRSQSSEAAESSYLVKIEFLRGEVDTLKTELEGLINSAKQQEAENVKRTQELQKKVAAIKKRFSDAIANTQRMELKNLSEIDSLRTKLNVAILKLQNTINAGKLMEQKLNKKIISLLKNVRKARADYVSVIEACRKAELQNFVTIDNLRTKLDAAVTMNKILIAKMTKLAKARASEDAARSRAEQSNLMQIDGLWTDLNEAKEKNALLMQGAAQAMGKVKKVRELSEESKNKYAEQIKALSEELKNSNEMIQKLQDTRNKAWTKEENYFTKAEMEKFFGNKLNGQKITSLRPANGKMLRGQNRRAGVDRAIVNNNTGNFAWKRVGKQQQQYGGAGGPQQYGGMGGRQQPGYGGTGISPQQRFGAGGMTTGGGTGTAVPQQYGGMSQQRFEMLSNMSEAEFAQVVQEIQKHEKEPSKDEQLIDFAVDAMFVAILKMTDNDVQKANTAMNLVGAGEDLPSKLDAVVKVVKEQFEPSILDRVMSEIARRYQSKQTFTDATLQHVYGPAGDKLIHWSKD